MNMTDYETTRRTFRLHVPDDYEFTRDVVEHWAAQHPGKLALVALDPRGEGRREITFAELARSSRRVANALEGLGLTVGERAFVMLPRIPEWYELLLGMFRYGVVPMPATTLCTARDIAQRIERAQATVAVVDEEAAAKLATVRDQCSSLRHVIVVGAPVEAGSERYDELVERASEAEPIPRVTRADDPLLLYFTSGTVAAPKMVLHTHASMGAGHEITARFWQDLTPADLHWTFSDTGWAKAAWGKLFGQWRMGASVFLWDQRGKLDPEQCLRVLERSGVTTFCAPPTLFRAFVQLDLGAFDLTHVRHTVSAGEPLNPEVIRAWREATGTTIYDGYGQTETVNLVANFPCLEVRPGSMGKPTPGNDVDVVSDEGVRLGAGEEGNIALATEPERPVGLMQGYWRDDDANAEVFPRRLVLHGRPRGQGRGRLPLVREPLDDVIISASYRIGPFEVESALVEHPAVAESPSSASPTPIGRASSRRSSCWRPGTRARTPRARIAGARQDGDRALQVPARGRVRRLAAQDDLGQDPSQRAARTSRDAASAVRDRALLRGARGSPCRSCCARPTWSRSRCRSCWCAGTTRPGGSGARPRARLHRDARLAASAERDRQDLRDTGGRRRERRRRAPARRC